MEQPLIAAIATPAGTGGIAIIRLSGGGAWALVRKLFQPKQALDWQTVPGFSLHYGHIVADNTVYDEVLLALMKERASYTREEMAEIQCHGGTLVARRILKLLLTEGATLASPGEFTKRAFLAGRLDLAQAEAVRETVQAQSLRDLDFSLSRLTGEQGAALGDVRQRLLHLIAKAEAVIDFPEDDLDEVSIGEIAAAAQEILALVEREIAKAEQGRLYREGLRTAIVGRTNVGKSSLLNALLQEERAIVTDLPGTTRDTIEEAVLLHDVPLRLIDTAGIRETADPVESLGVDRSRRAANDSDLVLFVFDGHAGLTAADSAILATLADKKVIALANKMDLGLAEDIAMQAKHLPQPLLPISAKESRGFAELAAAIEALFLAGGLVIGEGEWVGNLRHQESFLRAQAALKSVLRAVEEQLPLDFLVIDLYTALTAFGEISGENFTEEILDRIFSEFCIGK